MKIEFNCAGKKEEKYLKKEEKYLKYTMRIQSI